MTVLRLASSELKRMTYGLLPKLTILALVTVPLLYGAVYLYANWDPYKNMNQIPAALVVEDRGADSTDGARLEAGNQVAQNLVDGHLFDWHRVGSAAEAEEGVRNGTYGFSLTLPADFSSNLVSPASFDSARQAMLKVTTNDANNYLLSTIVDKVTTAVHDAVAKQVGTETAARLLTGYGVIHTQLVTAADGATKLAGGLDQLKDGSSQLADGAGQLHTGADQLKTGADQLGNGATRLSAGTNQLVAGQEQLLTGAQQLSTGASQLSSGLGTLEHKTASLPADTRRLADGAAQVAAGNAQLNAKVQQAVTAADSADAALQGTVTTSAQKLVAAGVLTQSQADQLVKQVAALEASTPITDARSQLHTAAGQVQQLATGSQQVSDGAAQLAAGMPALTSAIAQAHDGAAQLSTGANQLAAGEQQAVDGSKSLASGASQLADGATQLADGAGQLADGAARLDTGAAQLRDGLAQADDGAHELAAGLNAGAGKVPNPSQKQVKDVSNVMGDPVAVDHTSQTKAASYGAGLAPFFLSLAMWVGIFMLMQAMRPFTVRALASNAPPWKIALGGWLPFAVVASVQATLLTTVVDFALGLDPTHPVLMWLFLLLGGVAFSAIIHGIVALLGTSGKFVVLILLILQLVSSGGTFPWQMTPEPFRIAHQVLPMGYVVQGMRHLIYGGDLSGILPIVLGLIGYTALGGLLNFVGTRKNMTWRLKTLQPEIAV